MRAIIIPLPTHEVALISADPASTESRERDLGRPIIAWAIDDATGRPAMRWIVPISVQESGELAA